MGTVSDVIAGRARVLKPAKPRSYKGVFRVVGDKVIVPRKKGQRVRVGRKGEIEVARKIGGKMRRGRFKRIAELAPDKVYILPLARGDGIAWMKFDSRDELNKFVFETSPKIGATYKNFASYILEMDATTYERREEADELEDYLDARLMRQIRKRRAARRRK